MHDAVDTYRELYKLAAASKEVQTVKLAFSPALMKSLVAAGLLGTGAGAYALGKSRAEAAAEKERESTRNLSYLAGLGSGLALPPVLKGLGKTVGMGATPGSQSWDEEFTEI
jgi:hypothetical protein